jgi:hypothetical protein
VNARWLTRSLGSSLLFLLPISASAQTSTASAATDSGLPAIDGYVSVLADFLPHMERTSELRTRIFAERSIQLGPHIRVNVSGFVEGLLADREGFTREALARPQDLYVELGYDLFDVRVGFTRLVWGRLDEFQPTDVVNPLDLARFFLEGRTESRLPVALVRGRLFLPGTTTLEGVLVPAFRPGRFDQLDEPTSPFNLTVPAQVCTPAGACAPVSIRRHEPPPSWDTLQGGARAVTTTARVDWGVSGYYGYERFGLFQLPPVGSFSAAPIASVPLAVDQVFPRFGMVGGDFETVRGEWVLRGELAVFVRDTFQIDRGTGLAEGHSFEGGLGVERKAGENRLSGNVLVTRQTASGLPTDTDVSLVAALDRSFRRDTLRLRGFGVYNTDDRTAFLRQIASVSMRDNVWIEGSIGWFLGDGTGTLGQFGDRDFLYGRLKVYF